MPRICEEGNDFWNGESSLLLTQMASKENITAPFTPSTTLQSCPMSFSVQRQFRDTLINLCGITPAIKSLHDDQKLMRSWAKNSNQRARFPPKTPCHTPCSCSCGADLERKRLERRSIHKHLKLGFFFFSFSFLQIGRASCRERVF